VHVSLPRAGLLRKDDDRETRHGSQASPLGGSFDACGKQVERRESV
jgi:hypothetical protein